MKVTAEENHGHVLKRLRLEYGFFETESLNRIDIAVKIGKINRIPNDYVKIDGKYLIGDDWIYLSDSYKIAKWNVYIQFKPNCINLVVDPNIFACDLIPPLILTPLIGFWLSKSGSSLVHASGISFEDEAVLITGFGGSGKTSIALRAIERELKIFGDDHVILDNGKVLAFPTALSLFKYNVPSAKSEWIRKHKMKLELNNIIRKFTFGYIYPVAKAPINHNFIKHCARLKKVILIEPYNGKEYIVEEVKKEELVESWVRNILWDSNHLYRILCAFSYINSSFFDYFENLKETLLKNLIGCKQFIRVIFPQNNIEKLFETVLSIAEYESCKL